MNNFKLIRGHTFNKFTDFLSKGAEKVYDALLPAATTFGSEALKAFTGSINSQDNWGMFGSLLGNKLADVFTTPKGSVNAILPPTQGTLVNYGPALPPNNEVLVVKEEAPRDKAVLKVEEFPDKRVNLNRGRRIVVRRPQVRVTRPRRKVVTRSRAKTVSELTAPKKKKSTKRYRYKAEI